MSGSLDLSVRTGLSSQTMMENLGNLLELSHDPHFRDLPASSPREPRAGNPPPPVNADLDISRISNRLLVMGRCWNHRTDREAHRNSIDDLARFLNFK